MLEALKRITLGITSYAVAIFIAMSLVGLWLLFCKKAPTAAKVVLVLFFAAVICVISYSLFFHMFF